MTSLPLLLFHCLLSWCQRQTLRKIIYVWVLSFWCSLSRFSFISVVFVFNDSLRSVTPVFPIISPSFLWGTPKNEWALVFLSPSVCSFLFTSETQFGKCCICFQCFAQWSKSRFIENVYCWFEFWKVVILTVCFKQIMKRLTTQINDCAWIDIHCNRNPFNRTFFSSLPFESIMSNKTL